MHGFLSVTPQGKARSLQLVVKVNQVIASCPSYSFFPVFRCIEKGREKCDHYWPFDTEPVYYGDIQVPVLSSNCLFLLGFHTQALFIRGSVFNSCDVVKTVLDRYLQVSFTLLVKFLKMLTRQKINLSKVTILL